MKTQYGYHIIRLDGIQPGRTKTLAEARPQLQAQIQQSEATNRFGDIEDQLQDGLQSPGASLAGLAKQFNLTTGEVPQFLRDAGAAPLGQARPLQSQVFGSGAVADETLAGPVILDNDKMVIFEVTARHPAHIKPLADVRDNIIAALQKQREQDAALAAAKAARAQLLSGTSFDQVAKSLRCHRRSAKFIGRGDPSVPAEILVRGVRFDEARPWSGVRGREPAERRRRAGRGHSDPRAPSKPTNTWSRPWRRSSCSAMAMPRQWAISPSCARPRRSARIPTPSSSGAGGQASQLPLPAESSSRRC